MFGFFPGCPPDPEDAGKKIISYFFIMKAKGKFTHTALGLWYRYIEVFFPGCPPDPEDTGKKILSYFFIMKAKGTLGV